MMLLINEKYPERQFQISGVDRLFLAPELYKKNEVSELNDVWSIGAILYLLVTGGIDDKKHEEKFDFREQQWLSVSEDLMEFILGFMQTDPKKRMTVKKLL